MSAAPSIHNPHESYVTDEQLAQRVSRVLYSIRDIRDESMHDEVLAARRALSELRMRLLRARDTYDEQSEEIERLRKECGQ